MESAGLLAVWSRAKKAPSFCPVSPVGIFQQEEGGRGTLSAGDQMRQAKPRSRTPTHLPCCSAPLNSATASRRCLFPALSAATHLRVGRKPRLRPCGSVNKCAHIARYGSRRRRPPAPAGLERRGRRLLARRRRWECRLEASGSVRTSGQSVGGVLVTPAPFSPNGRSRVPSRNGP